MNIDKLYDRLSKKEQYLLVNRKNILKPRFPRSLFAYENRFQIVTTEISDIILRSRSKLTYLDIGCGDGVYEKLLSEEVRKKIYAIGIDFSQEQLKKAAKFFDKTYRVNFDSDKLPIENKSADIVICSEVLEHLFFPEKIISEVHRVLKPRGTLIITVPNFSSAQTRLSILLSGKTPMVNYTENREHIRFYSLSDVDNLIKGKFTTKKIRGIGSFLFDHWNCTIRLPFPRILQTVGDRYFPQYANGLMIVATKK